MRALVWVCVILYGVAVSGERPVNAVLFPSAISARGHVVFMRDTLVGKNGLVHAAVADHTDRCFNVDETQAGERDYREAPACTVRSFKGALPCLPDWPASVTGERNLTQKTAEFTRREVPSLRVTRRGSLLHFQAPDDGSGRKVQHIGRIVDTAPKSTYIFEEGDYYIDAFDIRSANQGAADVFQLKTRGRVRIFLGGDSVIAKDDARYEKRDFIALNDRGKPSDLLIVSLGKLRLSSSRRLVVNGFILGYDSVCLAGNKNSGLKGAVHSEKDLSIGHERLYHPMQKAAGTVVYTPGELDRIDLNFSRPAPGAPELTLRSAIPRTRFAFRHIGLRVEARGATSIRASNRTDAEEHNRTVDITADMQPDGTTFYLYAIPLIAGTNRILLTAEGNGSVRKTRMTVSVDSDANRSVPLKLRASRHRGVGTLKTVLRVSTLLDATSVLFDIDGDGIVDQTLTPVAHSENNVTYYTAELNATYTQEGRYRPRVTVETQEGVLLSSDAFALSLDVVSDTNQKDPKGAKPLDVDKDFKDAVLQGDRGSIERLLGNNKHLISLLYGNPNALTLLQDIYRKSKNWQVKDWGRDGRESVSYTFDVNGTTYGGGLELMLINPQIYSGREWVIDFIY